MSTSFPLKTFPTNANFCYALRKIRAEKKEVNKRNENSSTMFFFSRILSLELNLCNWLEAIALNFLYGSSDWHLLSSKNESNQWTILEEIRPNITFQLKILHKK